MIVLTIIGILAALAIPAYQDYIARAQMVEALILTGGLKTAVAENWAVNGACLDNSPGSPTAGVIAPESDISGRYVASVQAATGDHAANFSGSCTITATLKGQGFVAEGIQDKTLTLRMDIPLSGGPMLFTCTSNALQKYLPRACTGVK